MHRVTLAVYIFSSENIAVSLFLQVSSFTKPKKRVREEREEALPCIMLTRFKLLLSNPAKRNCHTVTFRHAKVVISTLTDDRTKNY